MFSLRHLIIRSTVVTKSNLSSIIYDIPVLNRDIRVIMSSRRSLSMSSGPTPSTPTAGNGIVIVEKMGAITTIGINRPEKRNCVNKAVAKKLSEAISNFEEDETSCVGVLYGTGGNFCAGYDLEEVSNFSLSDATDYQVEKGHGPMGPSRRFIKKPLIAAVSGYAVAGGLELAMMCDLRVVEETAVMGVFCRRFGVPLIDGGTVRLQAAIGLSRAMDMILTGRAVTAKEAFEWGLANRMVACGTALGQAINLAKSLVKFPQACLRADRESAYYSAFSAKDYDDSFDFELEIGSKVLAEESIQGAKRFISGAGKHGTFTNLIDRSKL